MRKRRSDFNKKLRGEIYSMYIDDDRTPTWIAKKLDVTRQRIHQIITEMKVVKKLKLAIKKHASNK